MVVISESFLQHLESQAIQQSLTITPLINLKSFKRYVDDSQARFPSQEQANEFLKILNSQHPNIQYTIENEDENKTLNFLDISIINKGTGNYQFKVFRKDSITNVQIKPNSCHDPTIIKSIFTGFVDRAIKTCDKKYLDNELTFLTEMFTENGYDIKILRSIIKSRKNRNREKTPFETNNLVSLPWIPGVSPKLKKDFKKAGYKAVFKAGRNLNRLLTSKNKPQLEPNSNPGIYKLDCSCGKSYVGETRKKIASRITEHQKSTFLGKWDNSAVSLHAKTCHGQFNWHSKNNTVKIEERNFDRKSKRSSRDSVQQVFPIRRRIKSRRWSVRNNKVLEAIASEY